MTLRPSLRFALSAALVAGIAGAAVLFAMRREPGAGAALWTMTGWAPVAAAGVLGGAWLVELRGRVNRSFFVAFGVGMAARSLVVLGTVLLALASGTAFWKPCLAGLVAGYVPVQLFEVVWFARFGLRDSPAVVAGHGARGMA